MLMIFYFKILNLRVRENEISLPKWSGGTGQLRQGRINWTRGPGQSHDCEAPQNA